MLKGGSLGTINAEFAFQLEHQSAMNIHFIPSTQELVIQTSRTMSNNTVLCYPTERTMSVSLSPKL